MKIMIDGEEVSVWYKHRHDGAGRVKKSTLHRTYFDAVDSGQVVMHEELPELHGFTICQIEDENRVPVATGYSFCGDKDQFSREEGRYYSLIRAWADLKGITFYAALQVLEEKSEVFVP